MALEAGRVGVRKDQVDSYGRVKGSGGETDPAVTKLQTQVGTYSFRTNPEDGTAQYRQSESGEWKNFSAGGGGATLLWTNDSTDLVTDIEVGTDYDTFIVIDFQNNIGLVHNVGIGSIVNKYSDTVYEFRFMKYENGHIKVEDSLYQRVRGSFGGDSAHVCYPYKIYGLNMEE